MSDSGRPQSLPATSSSTASHRRSDTKETMIGDSGVEPVASSAPPLKQRKSVDKSNKSKSAPIDPNSRTGGADVDLYCQLCEASQLPEWHFQHRGVRFGYRRPGSKAAAFYSLFRWHNESINIWSHYISVLVLIAYFYYKTDNLRMLQRGGLLDNAVIVLNVLFANIVPMFTSAYCHHFYCVDKTWHSHCWFVDFSGILGGMYFGGIGFVYFAFYSHPQFAAAYLTFLTGLGFYARRWCWGKYQFRVVQSQSLIPKDRFPEFSKSLSSFVTFSSFIPLGLALLSNSEEYYYNTAYFYDITVCSIVAPVLLSIGVVVFAQGGFPERLCGPLGIPANTFDFIGHSHQWWHIVTSAVMFVWINVIVSHYNVRVKK